MRDELLLRVTDDQRVRSELTRAMQAGTPPDSSLIARITRVDSGNTAWLRDAVAQRGWPDRTVVGEEGASAAFLLVQHADRDTAFQARMLPALEAAYRRGEAEGQHVALLTDRLAVARGTPQLYGTQAELRDGRFVPNPIRDSAGVDARRAAMGLMPLKQYLHLMDSVYLGVREPPL